MGLVVSWSAVPGAESYAIIIDDGEIKHVNWQTNCLQKDAKDMMPGSGTSVLVKGLRTNVLYKAKVAMQQKGAWSEYSAYSAGIELGTTKRCCETECTICMNMPAQVAMDPCGHLCACERCAASLENCPLCRGNIAKKLR